jgi:hypothetical protein
MTRCAPPPHSEIIRERWQWDAIKGDWVGWGGDTLANVSCEVDCIVTSHGQKFDNQLV